MPLEMVGIVFLTAVVPKPQAIWQQRPGEEKTMKQDKGRPEHFL